MTPQSITKLFCHRVEGRGEISWLSCVYLPQIYIPLSPNTQRSALCGHKWDYKGPSKFSMAFFRWACLSKAWESESRWVCGYVSTDLDLCTPGYQLSSTRVAACQLLGPFTVFFRTPDPTSGGQWGAVFWTGSTFLYAFLDPHNWGSNGPFCFQRKFIWHKHFWH